MDVFDSQLERGGISKAERFVRKGYDLVERIKREELESTIFIEKGMDPLSKELTDSLHNDVFEAMRIANKISPLAGNTFWLLVTRIPYFASESGHVGKAFLEAESPGRVAGIVHEIVHNIQDEMHVIFGNSEGLPMLAEFLFTKGQSRVAWLFNTFNESMGDTRELHARGWDKIKPLFSFDELTGTTEEKFRAMLKKRKEMSEDEKIEMIRSAISDAEKPKRTID